MRVTVALTRAREVNTRRCAIGQVYQHGGVLELPGIRPRPLLAGLGGRVGFWLGFSVRARVRTRVWVSVDVRVSVGVSVRLVSVSGVGSRLGLQLVPVLVSGVELELQCEG